MSIFNDQTHWDVIVIGAGGAGMMCAIEAGRRNRRVLLLDHSSKIGGKILISGGGRCNFTNKGASPHQYISKNPHFCKSALSRYLPDDFIKLVQEENINYHEKKLGQLFCDDSAQNIVNLLKKKCEEMNCKFKMNCKISKINSVDNSLETNVNFEISTSEGIFFSESLVIATGGLSIPKIGATGFGYKVAQQFGLACIETAPALDGFILDEKEIPFRELAGVSIDCTIQVNDLGFRENILFTHSGLSGPAALQASLHWYKGNSIEINLLPEIRSYEWFLKKKKEGNRALVKNLLSDLLPARFSEFFCKKYLSHHSNDLLPLPQVSEKFLELMCFELHHWKLFPVGTVGYSKAEVTRGGVDTNELSSKTMESKKIPHLYFIGEVVDVTGWLGGYNFQWAWASGWAAGQVV